MDHFALESGERQTAQHWNDIRADHRFRYQWAHDQLPAGGFGIDCFCGNGYGTALLSERRVVLGVDGSAPAIAMALQHYATDRAVFQHRLWPCALPKAMDFAVSLESIEHVADGEALFAAIVDGLRPGAHLIYSTPNADLLALAHFRRFHSRHYTLAETLALATTRRLSIEAWRGQNVYLTERGAPIGLLDDRSMQLIASPGQFTIVHAVKPTASARRA